MILQPFPHSATPRQFLSVRIVILERNPEPSTCERFDLWFLLLLRSEPKRVLFRSVCI